MKKITALLLATAMLLCLTACRTTDTPNITEATTVTEEKVTTIADDTSESTTVTDKQEVTTEALATDAPETEAPATDAPETEVPATNAPATESTQNDPAKKLYGLWEGKYDIGAIATQYVQLELGVENIQASEGLVDLTIVFEENGKMHFMYNADQFVDVLVNVMTSKECLDFLIDLSAEASEVSREEFMSMMSLVVDDVYSYFADTLVASYTDPAVVSYFGEMLNQTYTFEIEGNTLCLNSDLGHFDYKITLEGDNLTLVTEGETLKLTKK